MCSQLPLARPHRGPGPQLRHVPRHELNRRLFGMPVGTQSTELHQPGQQRHLYNGHDDSAYVT